MGERLWVSNYSLDDVSGGAEVLGSQFCKAMKLKYMSRSKMGVNTSEEMDERLSKMPIDLLVYNSTNCWSRKPRTNKSIAVCCEHFDKESKCLDNQEFKISKAKEWLLQRKALENADKIISISEGEYISFRKSGFKTIIIEPYIDLETFRPNKKITRKRENLIALFIGRNHSRKGYDIVIELQKRFSNINFLIQTTGNLTNEVINDLYNMADFLIMPSRYESFGYIYAEALATNLPIISSRVGLFETWQPEQYGIFPKEITVDAFEDAINEFISGKRPFANSRELAEQRFSYKRFKEDCDGLLSNW